MRILVVGGGEELKNVLHLPQERAFSEAVANKWFDLAAILPGCEPRGDKFRCGTLLLWETEAERWLRAAEAEQVVSCGFSARNTLTPASTEPGRVIITVQRELKRPDGSCIWPQDIPLPAEWGRFSLPQQMMLAGLRLLGAEE